MEKQTNENSDLNSWDGFVSGAFLKAADVKSEEDAYVCKDVSLVIDERDNSPRPRLHLERNEDEFYFDLNKTNARKLSDLGVPTPGALIGAKIYFRKVLVTNPQTKREVEGLRIHNVETDKPEKVK